jgi:hypothetical protein
VSFNFGASEQARARLLALLRYLQNEPGVIVMVQEIGTEVDFRTWAEAVLWKYQYRYAMHNPYKGGKAAQHNGVAFIFRNTIVLERNVERSIITRGAAHLTSMTATFTFATTSGDKQLRLANVYVPCIRSACLDGLTRDKSDEQGGRATHVGAHRRGAARLD